MQLNSNLFVKMSNISKKYKNLSLLNRKYLKSKIKNNLNQINNEEFVKESRKKQEVGSSNIFESFESSSNKDCAIDEGNNFDLSDFYNKDPRANDEVAVSSRETSFTHNLAAWSVNNKITQSAMNNLLQILREDLTLNFLPKDSRTFLYTPVGFTTPEELTDFERELSSNFVQKQQLIERFRQIGGKGVGSSLRKCLKILATDETLAQFSWVGIRNKLKFCNFVHVLDSIYESIIKNNPEATQTEINNNIKNLLKHSQERLMKKNNTVN